MAAARSRSSADETKPKPRSDAYVGLLALSLVALSAAMLFAYLNYQGIAEKPKAVQTAPTGGGTRTTPPGGGAGGMPPGGPGMPGGPGVPGGPVNPPPPQPKQ